MIFPNNNQIKRSVPEQKLFNKLGKADDIRDFNNAATFAANLLSVVEETDENNRLKISFTDKMGRIVCVKQQMVDVPASPPALTDFACTYTLYDDFGRVAYVIPPETYRFMKTNGSWSYNSLFYTPMEFKYNYDARGRLSVKNVPSGGATTISYDKLDRPVLTRDANSVATYTRYDILGRPVMIGKYTDWATPADTDPLYETPAANTNGYTTATFPTDNLTQLYKVMYYDNYDLDRNGSISAAEGYTNPSETGYETVAFLRTRGKATATKTAILKNDGTAPTVYLTARTYYDKEYAVIQVNKQNHLSGSDVVSNAYDFANRLVKTRRDHTATVGGSAKSYTTREEYVYDDASRLRFTRHKINTGNWVVTSAPVYDELGRLSDKRLNASNYDGVSAVTLSSSFNYLQSVDYTYNIRNWLTGINDPTTCTLQSGDQQQDLFRLQLNYETALSGSTPQYNGNISSMQWNTYLNGVCGQRQLYMFSYDAANRLTAATHRNWNGASWTDPLRYSESGITYDLNGNIKTYNRKGLISTGVYGDIDLLAYTYGDTQRPDRLTKVVDTGNAGKGFKYNPPATGNHYAYDATGNMTTDNHKKTTITYNYLNLPTVITFTDGTNRKIEWVYDADGTKISKTTSTGVAVNGTKDYVGGIEYNGTNLEAIYFAEGRITPNGAAFFYEYTIKDHLGNTRITFRANGTSLTTLQENHYYPFGLEMEGTWQAQVGAENAYQYNGKELNEDFGLNWYDYGARWYDAAVGRWWQIDPFTAYFCEISPYSYTANNPINYIDVLGLFPSDKNLLDDKKPEDDGRGIVIDPRSDRSESNIIADDIYYDPNGNEVARIVNDEPDRYFDVVPDGNGHWTVVGERSSKPNSQGVDAVRSYFWGAYGYVANHVVPIWGASDFQLGKAVSRRLKYHTFEAGAASTAFDGLRKVQISTPLGQIGLNTAKAYKAARFLKFGGLALGTIGIAMSAGELVDGYIRNDTSMKIKGGIGIVMGVVGFAGPIGLGASSLYFLVIEPIIFKDQADK